MKSEAKDEIEIEDNLSDRSKFKKVEMPVLSGTDTDS